MSAFGFRANPKFKANLSGVPKLPNTLNSMLFGLSLTVCLLCIALVLGIVILLNFGLT